MSKKITKKSSIYIFLSIILVLILLALFFYKNWMVFIKTGSKYETKMVKSEEEVESHEDNVANKYLDKTDEEIISTDELRKDPNWRKTAVERGSITYYFLDVLEKELFPYMVYGKPCVDAFYSLAFEKKIDLQKTLQYETVDFRGPHKDDSVKRMVDSIHEAAALSKSVLVKIFAYSFPTILRFMRYNLDIKGIFALIRLYSTSKEKNFLKKKEKLTKGKSLLSNPHLDKLDSGSEAPPLSFFKAIKLSSLQNSPNYITPYFFNEYSNENGSINGDRFLEWIRNKLISIIKEIHPRENAIKKSNRELSGIISILKAYSMNIGDDVHPTMFKEIIRSYQNSRYKLPDFREIVKNLIGREKNNKKTIDPKLLRNFIALFNIVIVKSKFLARIPLLPKDLIEQYPDLGLQLRTFDDPKSYIEEVKKYLVASDSKPLVPTLVLYLDNDPENRTSNNLHYVNVIHYNAKTREFILDSSEGSTYSINEKDLMKLLRFNIRNALKNSFSKFDRLILDEITWEFRDKFFENLILESEKYIHDRVGGDYVMIISKK